MILGWSKSVLEVFSKHKNWGRPQFFYGPQFKCVVSGWGPQFQGSTNTRTDAHPHKTGVSSFKIAVNVHTNV